MTLDVFADDIRHAAPTVAVALIAWVSKRIALRFTSTFDRLDALEEQQVMLRAHVEADAKLQSAEHDGLNKRLDKIETTIESIASTLMRRHHGDE